MSLKRCQAKNNIALVELWSAVPVLDQAPPLDAPPGVRLGRAQTGPWLQRSPSRPQRKAWPTSPTQCLPNLRRRNTLPRLDTAHLTNPTALNPLPRLRRIISETRQHLLQGPGHLPRHIYQTHRLQPQLFKKRGKRVLSLYRPPPRKKIAKVDALKAHCPAADSLPPPQRLIPGQVQALTVTSPTPPTGNSGDIARERRPCRLHPTLIARLRDVTAFYPAAFPMSPTDISGDTPPPTPQQIIPGMSGTSQPISDCTDQASWTSPSVQDE